MDLIINKNIQTMPVSFTPEFYKRAYRNYKQGILRELIALFERAEIDSFIGGCMTARNAGYKKGWQLTAASESPEDMRVAEFVTEVFNGINVRDLFEFIVESRMKIYSVIGLNWEVVDGKQIVTSIERFDQKYFRYDKDGVLKIDWGTTMREIPPDSALVTESNSVPLFLKVLKDYIRKEFGEDNWSSFLETFGDPFIVGFYPPGSDPLKAQMEEAVNSIAQSSRGVAPEGSKFEIIESKGGSGNHESYIDDCKRGISFTLLGHEMASGKRTGAQIGENLEAYKVKKEIAHDDMYYIEDKIKPLIEMLVRRNFNTTKLPRLVIDKSDMVDRKVKLQAAETAYEMGAEIQPEFFKDFGVPILNEEPLKKPDGVL